MKYTELQKVETIVKNNKTIIIYKTSKIGTKREFFVPITDDNKRLNSTLFARKYDAINLGKQYLNN